GGYRNAVRRNGPLRVGCPWQHRSRVDGDFCSRRENLQTANTGHVLRGNAVRLWFCEDCDGAVLLPDRSKGLSRHKFLSTSSGASVRATSGASPASSRRPI